MLSLCFHLASTALLGANLALAMYHREILLVLLFLHSAYCLVQFFTGEMEAEKLIKVFMESPLGLGAIVAYPALLSGESQTRFLPMFTQYVNLAVVGNIAMMMLLPNEEGLWRGETNRLTCALLTIWLLKLMRAKRFETVEFEQGIFLFNSVDLTWVYAHAAYRFVMITLPNFYTIKYLFMEASTLGIMFALAKLTKRPNNKRPVVVAHYFGLADTLCVASFSILSTAPRALDFTPAAITQYVSQDSLEVFGVSVHALVCLVALTRIF